MSARAAHEANKTKQTRNLHSPHPSSLVTTMTDQTHINLCFVLDNLPPTIGLSIPRAEIPNFTHFPLKWLRYLGYVIYGVEGELSETVEGLAVDYQQVDGLKPSYYYIPDTQTGQNPAPS